jgi:hypothetical protein
MTMATRAHIAKPVDAEELFLHLLGILEQDPSFVPSWDQPEDARDPWKVEPGPLRRGRATYQHRRKGEPVYQRATGRHLWDQPENSFLTTVGQGLASILEVRYAADGPLVWPGSDYGDEEDSGNTVEPMQSHLVSVDLDTAYGYRTPNGAGCADLHAYLLHETGQWLNECGVTEWVWLHEERGTWHGPDEIHLRGNAALAAAWFTGAGQ